MVIFRSYGTIDWFKGKITGKSHISLENLWFPVDFPLSQPIEWNNLLEGSRDLPRLSRSLEVKDHYRVSHTAAICRESIKGLWDLTLAVLAYDPCLATWRSGCYKAMGYRIDPDSMFGWVLLECC